jgi:hypothetical protein
MSHVFATPGPLPPESTPTFQALEILWRVIAGVILTFLPPLALCGIALHKGSRNYLECGLLFLIGIGACGYLAFWICFFSPLGGKIFSWLLPAVSTFFLYHSAKKFDRDRWLIFRRLLWGIALTTTVTLLVLSTGFVYGGFKEASRTAAIRFSTELPADNQIPYVFALSVASGHIPKPLLANWQSSDRPPLQTGVVLSEYAFFKRQKSYTVTSVFLQSLWIFALWLFLDSCGVAKGLIPLVLAVCLFSGFVFLNSLFVWPKLFAASYVIGLLALCFTNGISGLKNSFLGGALAAFSLLAHGGSLFALVGVALTLMVLRDFPRFRFVVAFALSAIVLYSPWVCYQKFFDPPGDYLLKMHLAGLSQPTDTPFLTVLTSAYAKLPASTIWHTRLSNLRLVCGRNFEFWQELFAFTSQVIHGSETSNLEKFAVDLRSFNFFYVSANLNILVLGLPTLLMGLRESRRTLEWRLAARCWILVGFTILFWCLIMYTPDSTVIHHGTYVIQLIGYSAALLSLWMVSPLLSFAVAAVHIFINVLLYVFAMGGIIQTGTLILALASLLLTLFVLISVIRLSTD